MHAERARFVGAAGAERARNRRGDAAAHRARDVICSSMISETPAQAGQRRGAELPDEIGVGDADGGLEDHQQHPGAASRSSVGTIGLGAGARRAPRLRGCLYWIRLRNFVVAAVKRAAFRT